MSDLILWLIVIMLVKAINEIKDLETKGDKGELLDSQTKYECTKLS